MNRQTDNGISELAGFANEQLRTITQMGVDGFPKANRINVQQFQAPAGNTSQSDFIELPTSNYAGSEPAFVEGGMPNFMPIPADLQEAAQKYYNPNHPPQKQPQQPQQPKVEQQPPPQVSIQASPQTIPEGFDFDLFQYAILKDISCNIDKILIQIDDAKKQLESKKKIVDTALATSNLGKK